MKASDITIGDEYAIGNPNHDPNARWDQPTVGRIVAIDKYREINYRGFGVRRENLPTDETGERGFGRFALDPDRGRKMAVVEFANADGSTRRCVVLLNRVVRTAAEQRECDAQAERYEDASRRDRQRKNEQAEKLSRLLGCTVSPPGYRTKGVFSFGAHHADRIIEMLENAQVTG